MSADPLWYKDAIIYELHIKSFFDANNDGIGDFVGLTQKLDYLQQLGITAIWLLPFYPSPLRDDGYDISDYTNVNPSYGSMADFRQFVRAAHKRNIRVITELVVNHTSDQHPWFQRARRAKPGSNHRDFYVWSDTDQRYLGTRIIFCDTEISNWTWDPQANAYYWHRFYGFQPDLNFDNPAVLRAILKVMRFWLDMGVDGLRLDAVPYICEREGTNNENLPETHAVIKSLRADIDATYSNRVLLAEANQWPEDVLPYFGQGDECHMAFHFPLMPRIYMAIAQEDRYPITNIMRQTPNIPDNCQWAIFLRNHDELTLEMVTDRERDYLWEFYAGDQRMRLNMGIRRRLAPLMENDRGRIDVLNSILMSMPGTPVLYYGDEIGMGNNVYLGDRDGMRTPMQWSPDRNGGFSKADPAQLFLPTLQDPVYGFASLNVEAQEGSPTSMLNAMRRLIAVRRDLKAMGRGTLTFLTPQNRRVLVYLRCHENEIILCVVNLARSAQSVELDLSAFRGRVPVELLGFSNFPPITDRPYHLTMAGHSFFWFSLLEPEQLAGGLAEPRQEPLIPPERTTLVVRKSWDELLSGPTVEVLTGIALPEFLPSQRWFAGKDGKIATVRIADKVDLPDGRSNDSWCLALVEVTLKDGRVHRYLLPLSLIWEQPNIESSLATQSAVIAYVRRFRQEGVLIDAGTQDAFTLDMISDIAGARHVPSHAGGQVHFRPGNKFSYYPIPTEPLFRRLGGEQSNSSLAIQGYAVLKLYRRLETGTHPEVEMGRFLTERTGFTGIAPLLGSVDHIDEDGSTTTLAILSGFVNSQGDGWNYVQDYLKRFFQDLRPGAGTAAEQTAESPHGFFIELITRLGRRTAELHRALCPADKIDPEFAPEPITPQDLCNWRDSLRAHAEDVLTQLEVSRERLDEPAVQALLDLRPLLFRRIDSLTALKIEAMKTRHHGDYHLGQVLVSEHDFVIIDFEGEPNRPLAERRLKHTPIRDLAGMIRSIRYAAQAAVQAAADLPASDRERLEPLTLDWYRRSVQAFLDGYRGVIVGSPCWPDDPTAARALLDLMLLDKALYEIGYELANRPAWIGIPVQGIVDLLETPRQEGLDAGFL